MVYPPISTDTTSRSLEQSTQSALCQTQSSISSLLIPHHHHHHQQQQQLHQQPQQQILYAPYNTIPNCLPPTNQPQCIYPNTRRNPTNTVTLRSQDYFRGVKNTKWKSRSVRVKEHQPNPNIQHSIPYPPPPLVLFDPIQNHLSTTPAPPITPIYVSRSSTLFNRGGVYSNENYSNYTPNVLTQPYYKPPEVQTYCFIDRPSSQSTFVHQQTIPPGSNYYNSTSNTNVNHQNIKSFVSSTSNVYSTVVNNDSRIIPTAVGPTQMFPSTLTNHGLNLNNYSRDNLMTNSTSSITNGLAMIENPEKIFTDRDERIIPGADRLFAADIESQKLSGINTNNIGIVERQCDDRFLDESSNFDFTIEAEKMVSELCNTTSCELEKDIHEQNGPRRTDGKLSPDNDNRPYKSHDSIDKSSKPWHFSDFSTEIKLSSESINTQAPATSIDKLQYPELIRKTIFWGCNEADKIIKNLSGMSSKQSWLRNLSSATKIALTKSSTCFPIFSGDKIFIQDLISSLLRVGNGWLILDHYLNKHHHPTLNDKYDGELMESFKRWEVSTNHLLQNVIKAFVKLEMKNFPNDESIPANSTIIESSFPGDISLYVSYGLFGDPPAVTLPLSLTPQPMELKSATPLVRKCPYMHNENRERKNRWSTGKESKLRTKWTISEHPRGSTEVMTRKHDEKDSWDLFPKDFLINPIPQLISSLEPQQKLHCSFFSSPNINNSDNTKQLTNMNSSLNIESIPNNENRPFWNPCIASSPLYKFAYNDSSPQRSSNEFTLVNQIEMEKSGENVSDTVNLSSWFSTIRNKRSSSADNSSSTWLASTPTTAPKVRESKSGSTPFRMDTNRQLRTLKNMRTIQCAPWTANHLIDDHPTPKTTPDEYDSSEDVRVYMKPGSYNVPKKKTQSRRSQKRDTSILRNNRLTILNNDETSCPTNSLVVSRFNISSSSSSTCSQDLQKKDATWKAACASAELLLDALKAKGKTKDETIDISTPEQSVPSAVHGQSPIENEGAEHEVGIELSGDDSESFQSSSLGTVGPLRDDSQKSNIKTDSWLIRTLNNVSNDETNEEKRQTEIEHNDEKNVPMDNSSEDNKKTEERSLSLETSHTIAVMTLVDVVGKATYSETVRKISSSSKPTSSPKTKITQQKNEYEKIENNSLCTIEESKNEEYEVRIKQENFKTKSDKVVKLKKSKICNDDRDWSIWYSSKRKQHNNTLGQVALGKLVNIHRAMWRIDVTRILKCPSMHTKATGMSNPSVESINMENYRKIVKNPIFLETIGYKLKNHEYRKVENAIRDFRKIIHNSKLYHKNNMDCIEKIENLSKKLEDLVQQHFADELSFDGINSSPVHNRKSPNRSIISSNTETIINGGPPSTHLLYNGEKETTLTIRKSSRTS